MADLPPPVQGPTAKEKKYDRQLRLWGATGQMALERSHILLVNSGPGVVGLETLKNLVLPGVGNFTVQDSAKVTEADLGVNFFLEEEHLGGPRAEHTCNLLKELNPDVEGHFITEPLDALLSQSEALTSYTLIIVTAPIRPVLLAQLVDHANTASIPLFYVHSVGFYSHFSVHLPPAFPVVDTHPSPETASDLRLLKPWPELSQYANEKTTDLEAMKPEDHGHVPWIALLLHFLENWKKSHNGQPPQTYKEKNEFKKAVLQAARTNHPEGGEENFDEAVAAVLKSLNLPQPSSAVKQIFAASECANLQTNSPSFWVIANAIGTFYAKHNVLPVPGSVPDMKARSADYIQLQNVYKSKARKDLAEVTDNVRSLEAKLQRTTPLEERDIEAFCKNAAHIKLVRGRPFHTAYPSKKIPWGDQAKSIAQNLTTPDSLIPLYIAFLAWDQFIASNNTTNSNSLLIAPGQSHTDADADGEALTGLSLKIVNDLVKEADLTEDEDVFDDAKVNIGEFARELARAGGAELHNIGALTGGVVSQEVIKVITEQYVPVDNTYVFDGIKSKSMVMMI